MSLLMTAILFAFIGAVVFSLIGLISGTDETAVMVPLTLLVVLLGAPPAAIFSFFMAAVLAKHLTHAVPTALMGIPGDTTAVPLVDHANTLRRMGMPHVALRKMISGGIIGAFIALPTAVLLGQFLGQFADFFKSSSGIIFTIAAVLIAFFSQGRWVSVLMIIPFAFFIKSLDMISFSILDKHLAISFFLGIAIGPMFSDILIATSSSAKRAIEKNEPKKYQLAPETKMWKGFFPNPLKILSGEQKFFTAVTTFISSLTFVFSPVGMTSLMGEIVGSRTKGAYKKSTTSLAVMNGVTESTYIAETIIPLIAFGIPLSPVALGPASPLFIAPPVFTIDPVNNLHTYLTSWEFFLYGAIGLIVAALIAYPFTMNYARKASVLVMKYISQEAIVAMFIGLACLLAFHEGQVVGIVLTFTVAAVGGLLNRILGIGAGVQFMVFYASAWIMLTMFGI
ncbi:tripartite tricarboxylate transporter permease [Sporosarcina sp. Marseille-Q4063]|uniref:tripartite tricarboxylate transporter permease n=1 Tax=Sporosarcina sp. Marseille-Q4063 TaxID=2810514 RepID=UPI001BB0D05D|nr:tripartite tricarboxylate transporter permease [Sporosarcina sp. Marseille-Q4063]QUW21973.1 tripartite tricarboxylate transporter permease [Sporosarcina sp. Marseille-Q4063]